MQNVKHKIVVLSGKGGVGKSTVACQLAMGLAEKGKKVGILDIDLCGPSVPMIMGVQNADVTQGEGGTWIPVTSESGIKVMSIQYLLPNQRTDAVVWRGPKKDSCIKQFINQVQWGDLDAIVIDTPPGTSDEHITLCEVLQGLNNIGAIMVTGPQKVACDDVRKELSFCNKLNLPVSGIVENMSGFVCPHCSDCTPIFSQGGGEALAKDFSVPFLGKIPIDPRLSLCEDDGKHFTAAFPETQTAVAINAILEKVYERVSK